MIKRPNKIIMVWPKIKNGNMSAIFFSFLFQILYFANERLIQQITKEKQIFKQYSLIYFSQFKV
jgi:hypothetical protein